jgi:predicted nucleotidyltransferase
MKTILKARVGSHLYGLDTKFSDEDFLGVFMRPVKELLGFGNEEETYVKKDPDFTQHELKKFMYLAAKGNPTVLELLFVPEYTLATYEGCVLVANRELFLSNNVRASFGGYAVQQARKLKDREAEGLEGFNPAVKNRYAKHARHCFRLMRQGRTLLETGVLNPRLDNPEEYFALGEMSSEDLIAKFEEEFADFDTVKSVLPDEPEWEKLNELLLTLRGV